MMARPRSSYADWGNLAINAVNTRQLSKMNSELSMMARAASRVNRESLDLQKSQLDVMTDALKVQFATALTVKKIEEEIVGLVSTTGSIAELLKLQENRESNLGSLRVIMHKLDKQLDEVENYFYDEYPEWGLKTVYDIADVIEKNNISVDSFSRSWEDIQKVEELNDKVARIRDSLIRKLTEEDA